MVAAPAARRAIRAAMEGRRVKLRWFVLLACLAFSQTGTSASPASAGKSVVVRSAHGKFSYELLGRPSEKPVIVLLHGASGPGVPFYFDQSRYFAEQGFLVAVPHYFDATGSRDATDANYQAWVNVVGAVIEDLKAYFPGKTPRVFLVGYSLGASIALASGAEGLAVDGIAEWYGSLPDSFFYKMKGMPPLLILHGEDDQNIPVLNAQQLIRLCGMRQLACTSHLYPRAGHGFAGKDLEDADDRTLRFFAGLSGVSEKKDFGPQ
jgi:carboxymethylenebutenolidase